MSPQFPYLCSKENLHSKLLETTFEFNYPFNINMLNLISFLLSKNIVFSHIKSQIKPKTRTYTLL